MARPLASTDNMMPKFDGMLDLTNAAPMSLNALEPVTAREFDTMDIEYEQFMEMPVVIRIHETADPRTAPIVAVGLNGVQRWIPRGNPIKIQRKFVENLLRSAEVNIRTVKNPDREADEGMIQRRTTTMPYGFELMWDGHPKGRAWLERVMHESR